MSLEKKLPSGAKLVVAIAPFDDGESLYDAATKELKNLKIEGTTDFDYNFFKDILMSAIGSKEFKEKIRVCAMRSTINGEKFTMEYFEATDKRQDYIPALFHIAEANIMPFTSGLFALLKEKGLGDLLAQFFQK